MGHHHPSPPPSNRRITLAVGAFAGTLLISIIASVELSTLVLNFSSVCFGSPTVWLGHPAGFRVAALDAQTTAVLPSIDVTAKLWDGPLTVARIQVQGTAVAELNLPIPKKLHHDALRLEVHVKAPDGSDTFSIPLNAVGAPGPIKSTFAPSQSPPYSLRAVPKKGSTAGDLELELFPMTGHLVSGLPNLLKGRITRGDRNPPPALLLEGVSQPLHPDAHGRISFTHTPRGNDQRFTFTFPDDPHPGMNVDVAVRPAQLLLAPFSRTLFGPGEILRTHVGTLPFRSPVHVDVWAGDVLLKTTSLPARGSRIDLAVPVPDDFTGMMRIDAYKNFLAPDGTLTSAHAFISATPNDYDGLRRGLPTPNAPPIVTALKNASAPGARDALAPLVLSRLFPPTEGAPLLRHTYKERFNEVTGTRDQLRAHVHQIFLASVGVGLLALLAWIAAHQRRRKKAVRAVVHEGIAQGEEWDPNAVNHLTRTTSGVDIIVSLLAIFLTIYAVYVLLTRLLQWGW